MEEANTATAVVFSDIRVWFMLASILLGFVLGRK